METIELNGLTFRVDLAPDDCLSEPWEEEDGHGPVSDWRRPDYSGHVPTAPGERVLHRDRHGAALVYDVREAQRIALRDGWGLTVGNVADLHRKLGRAPTRKEVAAAAVEADYWRLRRYCEGDWSYVTVLVTLLDVDGNDTDECECIGGVGSDCPEHIEDLARELAESIAARVVDAKTLTRETRIRLED